MREYHEPRGCPVCEEETQHLIHDAEHERDSSNDWSMCQTCGTRFDGWGQPFKQNAGGSTHDGVEQPGS